MIYNFSIKIENNKYFKDKEWKGRDSLQHTLKRRRCCLMKPSRLPLEDDQEVIISKSHYSSKKIVLTLKTIYITHHSSNSQDSQQKVY